MNEPSSSLRRTIVAMLTACMIGMLSIPSFAATVDEAQAKKTEAEGNLSSVNSEISEIKNEQAILRNQIDGIDNELAETLIDIEQTKSDIVEKKVELERDRASLASAQADEKEQYESMKDRICYMYENGNTSVLDALLSDDNFAQVLNKVDQFESMYEVDRDLLYNYIEVKESVKELVDTVSEEEKELETLEISLEMKQDELEQEKAEKENDLSDFDQKLQEAESLAAQYQSTISEMDSLIASIREAEEAERARISAATANEATTTVTTETSAPATQSTSETTNQSVSQPTETSEITCSCDDGESEPSEYGSGVSVASYACQFVGNPYVWGGTSLTNGCDCSGFVMSVYAHFGVSLPHSSSALRSVGYGVSAANIQPGDIVCYDGHCAIYIGEGKIVHASNQSEGIKISSNYAYRTVVAIRRIF